MAPWRLQFFKSCSPSPSWATSIARNTDPVRAPLQRSQLLQRACSRCGVSTGCSFLQGTSVCILLDPHGLWGRHPASPWSAPQPAEEYLLQCLQHLLTPLFSVTLVSADMFSLLFFLFLSPTDAVQCVFPSVKYAIDKVPPVPLMGFSLGSSEFILETAGTGSVQHQERLLVTSLKGHL